MTRWLPVVVGALAGAVVALTIGLVAVALAPENGFADLAVATVTRVFLVPVGTLVGGVVGHLRRSRAR